MMYHASVRFQRREVGYNEVCSGICVSIRSRLALTSINADQYQRWYQASYVETECRHVRCRVYPNPDASSPVVDTRKRSSKSEQTLGKYTRGLAAWDMKRQDVDYRHGPAFGRSFLLIPLCTFDIRCSLLRTAMRRFIQNAIVKRSWRATSGISTIGRKQRHGPPSSMSRLW